MKINRCILCILLVSILLIFTGCDGISNSNDLKTETKNFELDGTKKLSLNLNMGAGKLDVQSGTDTLAETEFIYDVPKWKPVVEYTKTGSNSTLNIYQVSYNKKGIENNRNDWNLNLNKIKLFVIDDAETMPKISAQGHIDRLALSLPKCQHLVFTDGLNEKVEKLIKKFIIAPQIIEVLE